MTWWRGWPRWAPYGVLVWAVLYATVSTIFAVLDLKSEHPGPPVLTLGSVGLAMAAAGACLATTRNLRRPGRIAVVAILVIAIPVLLVRTFGLPMHVVVLISGTEPDGVGLTEAALAAVGGGLLIAVALSWRRRLLGRCPRCGGLHLVASAGPLAFPPSSLAPARVRIGAYACMVGILPYAIVKTTWALGGTVLGITGQVYRKATATNGWLGALESVGIDITILSAVLAVFLMNGLLRPWGQVFPRWTLILAGRHVPRPLPLIPALLTAVTLSLYGTGLIIVAPLMITGVLASPPPAASFPTAGQQNWMMLFGGLAFSGIGYGLFIAARSYAARTRPTCAD